MIGLSTLNPYMTYIKIGAAAVALGGAGFVGYELGHAGVTKEKLAESRAVTKALTHVVTQDRASAGLSGAVRDHLDTEQAQTRTVTRTIIEKVPVYVHDQGPPTGANPGVTVGFALLHNYAASGTMPPVSPTPGLALDTPTGTGMPALSGVITRNYGVCRGDRSEVMAWREWWTKENALWQIQGPKQ